MLKHLLIIAGLGFSLIACKEKKAPQPTMMENPSAAAPSMIIDSSIKAEVEKHISPSAFGDGRDQPFLVYDNQVMGEIYENDSLIISTTANEPRQIFKSFHYWKNDTLRIVGAFGLVSGVGFSIEMENGKARLYHVVAAENPAYSGAANGTLVSRLEVPCKDVKMQLSEIPDSTKKDQVIYGYVEFKSADYYQTQGSVDGVEKLPRKKIRVNMKVYFKSGEISL